METLRLPIPMSEATALRTDIANMQSISNQIQSLQGTLKVLNESNSRITNAKLITAGHNPEDYAYYEIVDTQSGPQLLWTPKEQPVKEQ